jgi:hypothetical protein
LTLQRPAVDAGPLECTPGRLPRLQRWRPCRATSYGGRAEAELECHRRGRLRRAGLDDLAIADVIHAAAFFNWANRLMLSLGELAATAGP